MSCDVGEVTERLENELCYDCNYELCSFSNHSVATPTSQLILQPFFASPTSQALHLRHLTSRPWVFVMDLLFVHTTLIIFITLESLSVCKR